MLFVVLQHIDTFQPFDPRQQEFAIDQPVLCLIKFLLFAIAICGVNSFILISGWFGIKASWKGLFRFVFQVAFLYLIVYLVLVPLGLRPVKLSHLLSCFSLGYWFVHSYLILYILSPIINAFIDNVSSKTLLNSIIVFFIYQTLYGWIQPVSGPISMGYSPVSFIGLYLLARYMHLYGFKMMNWDNRYLVLLFFGIIGINTMAAFIFSRIGMGTMADRVFYYCSPLVIAQAVALITLFRTFKIQSSLINWLASSCFAVYLIHMHPMVRDYFFAFVEEIWVKPNAATIVLWFGGLIIVVYLGSILVDKIRLFVWNVVSTVPSIRKYKLPNVTDNE